jgi:hypothetical protein
LRVQRSHLEGASGSRPEFARAAASGQPHSLVRGDLLAHAVKILPVARQLFEPLLVNERDVRLVPFEVSVRQTPSSAAALADGFFAQEDS